MYIDTYVGMLYIIYPYTWQISLHIRCKIKTKEVEKEKTKRKCLCEPVLLHFFCCLSFIFLASKFLRSRCCRSVAGLYDCEYGNCASVALTKVELFLVPRYSPTSAMQQPLLIIVHPGQCRCSLVTCYWNFNPSSVLTYHSFWRCKCSVLVWVKFLKMQKAQNKQSCSSHSFIANSGILAWTFFSDEDSDEEVLIILLGVCEETQFDKVLKKTLKLKKKIRAIMRCRLASCLLRTKSMERKKFHCSMTHL